MAALGVLSLAVVAMGPLTIDGNAPVVIPLDRPAAVDVEFTNHNVLPVDVTNVRVRVRRISAPNADARHPCRVDDYAVVQIPAGVRIALGRRSTSSLSTLAVSRADWPRVALRTSSANQDGCVGAVVSFDYTASRRLRIR